MRPGWQLNVVCEDLESITFSFWGEDRLQGSQGDRGKKHRWNDNVPGSRHLSQPVTQQNRPGETHDGYNQGADPKSAKVARFVRCPKAIIQNLPRKIRGTHIAASC